MIHAYHALPRKTLQKTKSQGILLGMTGDKTDRAIYRTDIFLNQYRPDAYKKQGLDRVRNIYCYLAVGNSVIDITSGTVERPTDIIEDEQQVLLLLDIDPQRCYVSDLDTFDEIKEHLQSHKNAAMHLAQLYWQKIQRLSTYESGIQRPEIMVTYSIPPSAIKRVFYKK